MKEKIIIREKDRFNRLIVVSEYQKDKHGHKRFLCRCDCGNMVVVLKSQLTSGKSGSCGCYQKDMAREAQTKHGQCNSKIYYVWKEMLQRCYNKNSKSYKNYGSRGIIVCSEWVGEDGFERFYEWSIKNGYKAGLTIERINNNGNYEPSNCRWATRKEQGNNKRNNIIVEYNGKTHTVSEWSEILNIDDKKIRQRIDKLGWDKVKAVSTP